MSAIFAHLCLAAYDPDHARHVADFDLSATFGNAATDTQGIIGVLGGDTLLVAFRGTTNLRDILFDLRAARQVIPYDGMRDSPVRVHGGFIDAYESVRQAAVLDIIRESEYKTVIFTGHSLGAALATLGALDAAYWCEQWGLERTIINRNLGSPRVGNLAFKDSYERRVKFTTRFVNDRDLVTHLPPRELGFTHVGKQELIGGDDPGLVSEAIRDHRVEEYLKYMEAT